MKRILEYFRRYIFWIADYLSGQPVLSHLRDIQFHLEDNSLERSQESIDQILSQLLIHATSHTKFYKPFIDVTELSGFPVVNKQLIKSQRENFFSDDNESRSIVSVTTSGSTGTPFETYQDRNKRYRNNADTIYFAELGGYNVGQRLIYMKIWVQQKMSSKLKYWLQNIVPVDVIKLNDSQITMLLEKMNRDNSTYGLLGYVSAFELVCRYLDNHPGFKVRKNVKSIISMSESLNAYTRETMERHFGVSVVSRYSNLENGILAQQLKDGSGRYLVNTASYRVEILDMAKDVPVDDGEHGRIVVTDLYNYAMPMIRYDTGDVGVMLPADKGDSRRYLSVIEGRKLDLLYDTKGELVSSYIVYKNMWQYTEINQYQLIQEGKREYRFKINTDKEFQREEQLVSEFRLYLGEEAVFTIEYVSEIPLLASGKRKKIVNNYIRS